MLRRKSAHSAILRTLLVAAPVFASARPALPWGNQAHQMVNALAVENLPGPLRSYFRARKTYLVEHASDPDQLAGENSRERSHHYTDAEAYDRVPFPKLKKQFVDERRGPTELQLRNGDSIWQIENFTDRLADALRRRQWSEADRDAVFAAHYACDLTQPLHTVLNYDGQFTRQAGIHSRFETEMVNALKDGWVLKPSPAVNEVNLRARIFRELLASYRQRNAVFAADRNAVAGRSYVDPRFFPAFEKLAGPLAERRLEAAVSFVSSVWYTAWVRAGKPALPR
ncbi:MAG TPA: S1/P1 nuclease [Terriglobia bacterium]|nr:S1/P1 nuclease [Terriglobia bacterium]